jgi:tetratricopeptide (TPR) repeat protein
MKRSIFILIFFSITNFIFGQSNYDRGFQVGYSKGYCQDQGVGCLSPIPPIAPIPTIGENLDSYQDGYNRGFQMGLSAHSSVGNTSINRKRYQAAADPVFIDGISSYDNNLALKTTVLTNLINESKQELINENYDRAISIADRMIEIDPRLAVAYFVKSNAYYQKKEMLNSYNYAEKSDRIRGSRTEWGKDMNEKFSNYLMSFLENSDYKNLQYVCENVWYKNEVTNYYLALAYSYQGDLINAKKALLKLRNSADRNYFLECIEKGEIKPNPYAKKTEVPKDENNSNNPFTKIGELINNKKFNEAILELEKVKEKYPITSFYYLGLCNFSLGNYVEAISNYTIAINNSKQPDPTFYFYRSLAKEEKNDIYGAISDLEMAIELYEKNIDKKDTYKTDLATALNNKAWNLIKLKRYNEATPFIDKSLEMNNTSWYSWDTKGELEYLLGNYNNCITAMSKAINIKPNSNSYFLRGKSYIKLNQKENGCKDLSKAGELGQKDAYTEISKYCK